MQKQHNQGSAGTRLLSSFFWRSMVAALVVAIMAPSAAHAITKKKHKSTKVTSTMTVARFMPVAPADSFIEVGFSESARFYRLSTKANPSYLRLLKESEQTQKPVIITRASEQSDIILTVRKK